jgi:hypothetical protein
MPHQCTRKSKTAPKKLRELAIISAKKDVLDSYRQTFGLLKKILIDIFKSSFQNYLPQVRGVDSKPKSDGKT